MILEAVIKVCNNAIASIGGHIEFRYSSENIKNLLTEKKVEENSPSLVDKKKSAKIGDLPKRMAQNIAPSLDAIFREDSGGRRVSSGETGGSCSDEFNKIVELDTPRIRKNIQTASLVFEDFESDSSTDNSLLT
jgi:hypothetical protein